MQKTKVKICGIRDEKTAEFAINHGADYIGLIFYRPSRRHITDLTVARNIAHIAHKNARIPVAIFVEQSLNEILEICDYTGISTVQLHNTTQTLSLPNFIAKIMVVSVNKTGDYTLPASIQTLNPLNDFLLFDYQTPGSGKSFDHDHFSYSGPFNYFIAGGLNSENVVNCIQTMHPFAVDVSSAVEDKNGNKDFMLIKHFITRVKND